MDQGARIAALERELEEARHDLQALEDENARLMAALIHADDALTHAIQAVADTEAGLTRLLHEVASC